ncbi:MAG: FAD-dependent oxidoreductase [Pseudomonadota bacterium]
MKIVILGGGVGGVMTALRLAEKIPTIDIVILEKKSDLLSATSDCTPGRMGLGFHYVDLETASHYLEQTIKFVREFKDRCSGLMVGENFESDHPLRNGRYFITKDTLFSKEKILEVYEKLKERYRCLVNEDPENKVFGDPEHFYQILQEEEYKNQVNMEKVDIGIETREHLLNWPIFKKFLLGQLEKHSNIKIITDSPVEKVERLYRTGGYLISSKEAYQADFLINATWEHVAYFNSQLDFFPASGEIRTNRAKAMVTFELPTVARYFPSMFFCMGPYCMFSNLGERDGKYLGMITYAKETNRLNDTGLIPSEEYMALVNNNSSLSQENEEYKTKIILGVERYIPGIVESGNLRDQQIKSAEIKYGTVQVEGEVDIHDPNSKMHERRHPGFELLEPGFVSLACMKLMYGLENANLVVNAAEQYIKFIIPFFAKLTDSINSLLAEEKERSKLLIGVCFFYFKRESLEMDDKFSGNSQVFLDTCGKKFELNKEIKEVKTRFKH